MSQNSSEPSRFSGRVAGLKVGDAERGELPAHQVQRQVDLVDHLVVAAEDVRVVLHQLPHRNMPDRAPVSSLRKSTE